MQEEEAMAVFFGCVAAVTIVGMFLSTVRKMYQTQRETALKMKCLECGLNPRDIERVVGVKANTVEANSHPGYEFAHPMQKPIPPVVAAR